MNLQGSVQNIYKTPATLDDDLNLSGLKKSWHEYRLDNQTPQLFDYLKQLWLFEDNLHRRTVYRHQDQQFYLQEPLQRCHRFLTEDINNLITDKASFNAHNMGFPSTLEDGLHSGVQPSTSQKLISYPRTDQPFHGHPISKIAHAFASNKQRMQENLAKYINHSETVKKQSCMQYSMFMSGYKPLGWQEIEHNTTVPSIMTHI